MVFLKRSVYSNAVWANQNDLQSPSDFAQEIIYSLEPQGRVQ